MDRRNYESKAIGLFDTIGSYFVDMMYNNHYLISRDLVRRGLASNITDAYRSTITNYINGSDRDDLFKITVHKLHEYYQRNSGFGTIILSDFQDRILSQFIPVEYYRDFTDRHKDLILKEIIVRTVKDFGNIVLTRYLPLVIDNHLNKDNVTHLQDHIVDIFILQREEYYTRFAKEISKRNPGDTVDRDMLDKLKTAYMDEKRKCCELAADKERASSIVGQLIDKIRVLEAKVMDLEHKLRSASRAASRPPMVEQHPTLRVESTPLPPPQTPLGPDRGRSEAPASAPRARREQTPYPAATRTPDESDESSGPDDEEIHRKQQESIIASRSEPSKRDAGIMEGMLSTMSVDRALAESRGWSGSGRDKHANMRADADVDPMSGGVPAAETMNVTAMYTLDDDPWIAKD